MNICPFLSVIVSLYIRVQIGRYVEAGNEAEALAEKEAISRPPPKFERFITKRYGFSGL